MADFRYVLLLAYRSRVLIVLLLGLVAMLAVAWLGYQFSGRQPQTVALDLGISFIRVFVPVIGVLQVQEFIAKEIERKLIFTSLTYPRSRSHFLLARVAAIFFLCLLTMTVMVGALAGLVNLLGGTYQQGTPVNLRGLLAVATFFSLADVLVILAFATVLAVIATVPNLVLLVSLAFMVVARSLSQVIQLLYADPELVTANDQYRQGLENLRYLMPDLGLLDVRRAALYDQAALLPDPLWPLVVMPLAYAALLMAIACWKFDRRQFV